MAAAALSGGADKALEAELGCPVVTPADGVKFAIARDIWNALIDKTPSFIVKCSNARDVSRCIRYATRKHIPLSVKAGGHHPAGLALRNDGMTIDLSGMLGLQVDRASKRLTIEPGVRIGHIQSVLEPLGLYAVGPVGSTVGMVGGTLGGGFGTFAGEAGYGVDNLLSAEIATADGRIRTIDAQHEPDLFWAIRGGGGNFGVVTSMTLQVHDLQPLTGGTIAYVGPEAKRAAQGWYANCRQPALVPPQLMPQIVFGRAPQDVSVPMVAIVLKSALQGAQNADAVARFRGFGTPVLDTVGPMTLMGIQTMVDGSAEPGRRVFAMSHFLREVSDPVIDILFKALAEAPSTDAMALFAPNHGAVRNHRPTDTAFFHRAAFANGFVQSSWIDPAEDEKNIRWVRKLWNDLRPFSDGDYANIVQDTDDATARRCYGRNHHRLAKLKHLYDPQNVFSSTVNILPRA